jgi:hypothetical protein
MTTRKEVRKAAERLESKSVNPSKFPALQRAKIYLGFR